MQVVKLGVDWNEPELQRWLGNITKKGTRKVYKVAFRRYAMFTGMTAKQMIDEAEEDAKLPIRERRDVVKKRLLDFYNWLVEDYNVTKRGEGGERIVVRKGCRPKTANSWLQGIRSFYGTFGFYVKFKGASRLPTPRVYNKRMALTKENVKTLVDHARTPRDRAIILTLFQGGFDAHTLCSLTYGDVSEGLKNNEHPLLLKNVFRRKTGTEYDTFLGRDAVKVIRAYLRDEASKRNPTKFTSGTPLFVKAAGKGLPLKEEDVQWMVRHTARRAGLVDKENNGKDRSPVNPHALRIGFSSIAIGKGVDSTIVDFWQGHKIGEMKRVYQTAKREDLRQMYLELEPHLSITSPDGESLEALRKEMEARKQEVEESNITLQRRLRLLDTKNISLEKKLEKMDKAMEWTVDEIRAFQRKTLERLGDSPKQIEETMRISGSRKEDYLADES